MVHGDADHGRVGADQRTRSSVARLVGIDEREVEAACLARREQRVERLDAGPESEIDAIRHASFAPEGLADRGPLGADVTRDQLAIRWQRERHGERGVTGVGAELDAPLRADQPHEQRHQCALVRTDLHDVVRYFRCGCAQLREHIGFARLAQDVRIHVGGK